MQAVNRLGLALSLGTITTCLFLHAGTFLAIVPPMWLLLPCIFFFGSVLCDLPTRRMPRPPHRTDWVAMLGFALLLYAVLTFIYVYRATGGATSVCTVDGHYFSKYKNHIIRAISESEYQLFPNLWTRAMSVWIGMIAVFSARSFAARQNPKGLGGPSLA